MGLFGLFSKNSPKKDIYDDWNKKAEERNAKLEYQNKLLDRVNAAQAKYKADGDLQAVIAELEYAFVVSNPPCASSQNMDLATYYIKAGQNNKAWSYLNTLIATGQAPVKDVRFAQARILKKENKHTEAIRFFMFAYLDKSRWNATFQRDMFLKDISPSAKKLNLDEKTRNAIADIVQDAVKNNYDEDYITTKYKPFVV